MKASIQLPNGTKIEVEGTEQEVMTALAPFRPPAPIQYVPYYPYWYNPFPVYPYPYITYTYGNGSFTVSSNQALVDCTNSNVNTFTAGCGELSASVAALS